MMKLLRLICWLSFISYLCLSLVNTIPSKAVSSFQRTISISNTSGATQTNFQISVVFDTQSLITASKMRSDCGDIRIFNTDGITAINNYWVDKCNTTTTRLWIKVPSIATGNSTIFMRYGDLALTSLSSGTNTMEKYETMATTPTCTLKNSATYDAVNDWIQLTTATGSLSGQCEYSYNPGQGFYSKFEFQTGGGTNPRADAVWLYSYQRTTPTAEDVIDRGYHFTFDEYQDRICFTRSTADNGPCLVSGSNNTIDNNQWRTAEIFHSNRLAVMNLDGVNYVNGSDSTNRNKSSNLFGFAARTGGLNAYHRIRLAIVAKYLSTVIATLNGETQINTNLAFVIRNSADTANTNLCDFGNVNSANLATCSYRLKVTSDAVNGYTVAVQTSGDLANGANTISNANVGAGGTGGTDISNLNTGTEKYGAVITTGSITGTGTITRSNAFNAGATNAVNYSNASNQNLITSTGKNFPTNPDLTNTSLITHKLNISNDTVAGDYTQTITYTVIANF